MLDGGVRAWTEAGLPLTREEPRIAPAPVSKLRLDRSRLADVDEVQARRAPVLDARAPERYRGEIEPIDRKAGHIPGALNAPFAANLTPGQRFKPPEELRRLYQRYGPDLIVSCGSGVTACHDALDDLIGSQILLITADDFDLAVLLVGSEKRKMLQDVQQDLGLQHTSSGSL